MLLVFNRAGLEWVVVNLSRHSTLRNVWLVVGLLTVLGCAFVSSAHAAFPGRNGLLAFTAGESTGASIHTMSADGGAQTVVRSVAANPAWSPSGASIAFVNGHVRTMAADGTLEADVAPGNFVSEPAWAPTGDRIVFSREDENCTDICQNNVLEVRKLDGTVQPSLTFTDDLPVGTWSPDGGKIYYTAKDGIWVWQLAPGQVDQIQPNSDHGAPTVSPDGSRIAFTRSRTTGCPFCVLADQGIYVMQADGTNVTRISAPDPAHDSSPAWSPDGTRIAFVSTRDGNYELYTMNPDGSDQTRITNTPAIVERTPDWQPIPINAYPRPKSATPIYTPLVIAYAPCTSSNRVHAAPLSSGSCSPPAQASGQLTVGTPDANMRPLNGGGWVRLKAILDDAATPAADESDLTIDVNATDVRKKADLTDYPGELRLSSVVRATDKRNSPSPTPSGLGAATLKDVTFGPTVPCSVTSDTSVGSTCSVSTSVNGLIPGLIVGGARSIWQFDQITLNDGGPDSTAHARRQHARS